MVLSQIALENTGVAQDAAIATVGEYCKAGLSNNRKLLISLK